jgi:hypothetical protein
MQTRCFLFLFFWPFKSKPDLNFFIFLAFQEQTQFLFIYLFGLSRMCL